MNPPDNSQNAVSLVGVTKKFDSLTALNNVNLEIPQGQLLGLLGPNGAGKTTMIKILTGLLQPTAGKVCVLGNYDLHKAASRKKIGLIPQEIALYENLSAQENLQFFAKLYGLTRAEQKQKVQRGLNFAGLTDRARSQVKTFSGGMKRRLNIACSLLHDPEFILFDEPTVGVDPQSRNFIFEQINKKKKKKLTIIYTTHYMEEAQKLCDQVAIIDQGKILARDTTGNLIKDLGNKPVVEIELNSLPDNLDLIPGKLIENTLHIETDSPLKLAGELYNSGLDVREMHIRKSDLESVFLSLTGRSLRD